MTRNVKPVIFILNVLFYFFLLRESHSSYLKNYNSFNVYTNSEHLLYTHATWYLLLAELVVLNEISLFFWVFCHRKIVNRTCVHAHEQGGVINLKLHTMCNCNISMCAQKLCESFSFLALKNSLITLCMPKRY